ncbi:MAG TPA: YciI family protein [Kofleriaceae bacterium]|nr:YciI family protein [Kofleriaceae bacterium]
MRFMVMHKNDEGTEAGEPATQQLFDEMGAFIGEMAAAGKFLGGEGLGASKTRTRLTFRDGVCTVKHGPYKGERELLQTAMLIAVETREQAIGWAERYGKILGDGELELGPVTEAWDMGFGEKPAGAPLRVLVLEKADRESEAGQPRSAKQKAELTRLRTEMTKAGVLTTEFHLAPSATAKRLVFRKNDLHVIDGPFVESKELIGGFAIMELADTDEAIAMSRRYTAILGGTLEIDVRPLAATER